MESLGERHETLAIYLSDNGDLWGEHGIVGKRVPYTESIHVPRAMRWPGHLARGSLESNIATNVDLAPTILDAAGVEPRAHEAVQELLRQELPGHRADALARGRARGASSSS